VGLWCIFSYVDRSRAVGQSPAKGQKEETKEESHRENKEKEGKIRRNESKDVKKE
jgi:hypothetical protein